MNYKIDLKTILIISLTIILIGMVVFGPSLVTDNNEKILNKLKVDNKNLLKKNDSLILVNLKLDKEISIIDKKLDTIKDKLELSEIKIKELEDEKSKLRHFVDGLDADGVARSLSEYLESK
tara:strand:+ start:6092 stop:6454 length:363 start_codon:yes stop_codon:yes gene_type:complete